MEVGQIKFKKSKSCPFLTNKDFKHLYDVYAMYMISEKNVKLVDHYYPIVIANTRLESKLVH